MDFVGIVAAVVVAIAKPVGLNTSGRRVSATATDAVTHRLAAVGLVLAVIAVLVPVAHLKPNQAKM